MNNKELFSCVFLLAVLGGTSPIQKQHMHAYIYMPVNEGGLFCHTGSKNSLAGITPARWRGLMKKRAFLHNTGVPALARKVTAFSCSTVFKNTECCARSWLHGACLENRTHSCPCASAWSILMCLTQYSACTVGTVTSAALLTSTVPSIQETSSCSTEGWTVHIL